jgi:cytoskeletal protein CcmA (bactofilin family)
VANQPQKAVGKISITCPHCGFDQTESPFAQTTICRRCNEHFVIGKKAAPAKGSPASPSSEKEAPSFLDKVASVFHRERIREIRCHQCQTVQQVSSRARSSLCPHCGTYIDLKDFKVEGVFSRGINTQGTVTITPKGELTSIKVLCGEAIVRGKLSGNLVCSGETHVRYKGRLLGAIDGHDVFIEKGCDVEFVRPIKAHHLRISGKVSARVMADHISIGPSGSLEGTIYAKSITIDKGGIFHGELVIGKKDLEQPELLPEKKRAAGQEAPPKGQGMLDLGYKKAPARR